MKRTACLRHSNAKFCGPTSQSCCRAYSTLNWRDHCVNPNYDPAQRTEDQPCRLEPPLLPNNKQPTLPGTGGRIVQRLAISANGRFVPMGSISRSSKQEAARSYCACTAFPIMRGAGLTSLTVSPRKDTGPSRPRCVDTGQVAPHLTD